MIRENTNCYKEQGELYWNFARGADLANIFSAAIKHNDGFYRSEKLSVFVDTMIATHGSNFSCEVGATDLEDLELMPLKHQHMVIVGGRYRPQKFDKPIPICHIYIADYLGPVEKYKCRFTCTDGRKRLCDYVLRDIELVWKRDNSKK